MYPEQVDELKAKVVERQGASPARRQELGQEMLAAVPALIATVERLRESIWPGLPKWEPTEAAPQQDFYEALVEALRTGATEAEQYESVIQGGKRLPAPELSQNPAFAAFVLGGLEKNRDKLIGERDQLREWRNSVSMAVKNVPEFHSGQWAGDKEGWGFHFEVINWLIRERDRLRIEVEELKAIKIAYQEAPKQWSTAQAPTLESIAATVRQISTAQERDRVRDACGSLIAVLERVLPVLQSIGPGAEIDAAIAAVAQARTALAA